MKKKQPKLDAFHYHEIMDRAFLVIDQFEGMVHEHPVVKNHGVLKAACENASDALNEVYAIALTLNFPDGSHENPNRKKPNKKR